MQPCHLHPSLYAVFFAKGEAAPSSAVALSLSSTASKSASVIKLSDTDSDSNHDLPGTVGGAIATLSQVCVLEPYIDVSVTDSMCTRQPSTPQKRRAEDSTSERTPTGRARTPTIHHTDAATDQLATHIDALELRGNSNSSGAKDTGKQAATDTTMKVSPCGYTCNFFSFSSKLGSGITTFFAPQQTQQLVTATASSASATQPLCLPIVKVTGVSTTCFYCNWSGSP